MADEQDSFKQVADNAAREFANQISLQRVANQLPLTSPSITSSRTILEGAGLPHPGSGSPQPGATTFLTVAIPAPPEDDGVYVLGVTVASGTPTLEWFDTDTCA